MIVARKEAKEILEQRETLVTEVKLGFKEQRYVM